MDSLNFDQAAAHTNEMNTPSMTYDCNVTSPTAQGLDTIVADHAMSPKMHLNPGNMWSGPPQVTVDDGLEKLLYNFSASMDQHGQVTPPDDLGVRGTMEAPCKRADSGASGIEVDFAWSMSSRSSMSSKRSSMRLVQKSRRENRVSGSGLADDKKDRYREKNRIAAAKCRARKKEHTDSLEGTYRTQSAMNTALKQTEKSLRNELLYWCTQALQHTFCACSSIQEYNLRKAQSMAFGASIGASPSPVLANNRLAPFSHNHLRILPATETVSPAMRDKSVAYGRMCPAISSLTMFESDVKRVVEQ
jgi:hypothetical protein